MLSIAFANAGQRKIQVLDDPQYLTLTRLSYPNPSRKGVAEGRLPWTSNYLTKIPRNQFLILECDTNIMDDLSASDTIPFNEIPHLTGALG